MAADGVARILTRIYVLRIDVLAPVSGNLAYSTVLSLQVRKGMPKRIQDNTKSLHQYQELKVIIHNLYCVPGYFIASCGS